MFFLSFLLFSALYIDGENYVKVYRSSNEIDLFFFEQGFFNPAAGFGIVGADMNPAVLGKSDNVEFFAAFSLPGVSSNDVDTFSFSTNEAGTDMESAFLTGGSRLYGQYRALGGLNFIGFSKKLGNFGVGISYGGGYKLGVQASLSGSVYGSFQSEEPFEFTHDDFSEIPVGDVISVDPEISGGISFDNPVPLRVEYSDSPIFLGGGYSYGPVALGAGLKFQNCRIMGEGSFSARIDSLSVRVDSASVIDDEGDRWVIEDFSAELELNYDEDLFDGEISSTGLSTTHPLFTLGTLFDFPVLKLSLGFDFGGNYDLSGGYLLNFSWVDSLPEDFASIDSSGLDIDSVTGHITGTAVIVIDSMIREEESESDDNVSLTFAGSSFNFSFLLDLPLKLGFNGRFAFPSSDYGLNKLGACLYSRLPVPGIGVDLGLAADCVFLGGSEVDGTIFIPSATFGLSFSYERDYLCFYLPVKYDASHIAMAILGGILEDIEDEDAVINMRSSANIWDNLAFGLGFRVKM
jgi:hypothetical protein